MRRLLIAFLSTALVLPLTGCSDPCVNLPEATEEQQRVASGGIELEREYKDVDCELQPDGTWHRDD